MALETLQSRRVNARYAAHLEACLSAFVSWSVLHNLPHPFKLARSPRHIAEQLIKYVEYLYREGRAFSVAKLTVLSLQNKYRHLKGNLQAAWDLLVTWQLELPLQMRTPMPEDILWGLFSTAMLFAFVWDRSHVRDWLGFGIGMITMFWGLLRPGELYRLSTRLVQTVAATAYAPARALLVVERAKNQRTMGKSQIAIVSHVVVFRWLSWLTASMQPRELLIRGGSQKFRRLMEQCLERLSLPLNVFTPASFRAGGATALFISGTEVARLRLIGRWRSTASLDHYIQEAASTMVSLSLSNCSDQHTEACFDFKLLATPSASTCLGNYPAAEAAAWMTARGSI
jgi:hypothetical protein